MAEQSEAKKREIERLRSEHPEYAAKKARWEFFLLSYEGGEDYVTNDTLFKHQREPREDYEDRLLRASFANYCQPLVDFVPEFIYSQGVQRTPPKELKDTYGKFKKDVDRSGTALDAFMENTAEEARIFGHTWIGIDKLAVPKGIDPNSLSVAAAEKLGLNTPYFYHVRPLEVLDWVTDQFGNYIYIKRKEIYFEKKGVRGGFRKIERYTEWEKENILISRIDITTESEVLLPKENKPNPWQVIPFVQFFYKRSKKNKDIGISFLNDLADQNNHVFNISSLIGEFLNRQCFNLLAMEADTQVPTRDRADGRIGTSNVLWIPRGATQMPEYISPPVDPAQFLQSERSGTIKEMYRQAAQDVMAEVFSGGDVPSADAQKQAFSRTIPMIAKMADMMQGGETSLWTMWALMQDATWEGGIVAYRDDYSVTNVQDLLLQLSTIFTNLRILPLTFVKEEWKRIIQEFDGKLSEDTVEKIHAEIEKMSEADVKEAYQTPADVKAALGVPSTANLAQGKKQTALGTDRKIAMKDGSRANTKEANPDANRRAKSGRSKK